MAKKILLCSMAIERLNGKEFLTYYVVHIPSLHLTHSLTYAFIK